MASTLTSPQISATIKGSLAGGAAPATATSNPNHSPVEAPVVGSTSGQCNLIYSAPFAVSNGSPLALDLTSLQDPLGAALNFSQAHAILIENDSTTAGQDMTIFGGSNGLLAASTAILYAGTAPGFQLLNFGTTGVTVDSTHKIIQIAVAAGTNVAGKITVLGK